MISLDTETTGIDLRHGAKPFFVTICDENDNQSFWEWDVNPITREPEIQYEDLKEIQTVINESDEIVLQNTKFDVAALQTIFLGELQWNWDKVQDTLIAGHLLGSNEPHDLTSMALKYLRVNIQPYEDRLDKACNEARRLARSEYPDWRIAKKGLPEMPSAKEKTWKYDTWLPRAIALEKDYKSLHPWWRVCSEYANTDSAITIRLWKAQERLLKKRGLWNIYRERCKLLRVVYEIERKGVTLSGQRVQESIKKFVEESEDLEQRCTNIAKSYDYELELPKTGNNISGPIQIATACNAHGGTDRHDFESETFVTYAIQERAVSENTKNGPQGKGFQEGLGFTLEARHQQQSVAYRTTGNNGVFETGDQIGALNCATDPNQQIVNVASAVRRLTPRECERLQAFPDDWTRWGADGKEISNSARYRILGNAVTVNVAEWIGRRIMEVTS